jgi:hypothetical protein
MIKHSSLQSRRQGWRCLSSARLRRYNWRSNDHSSNDGSGVNNWGIT